MAEEILAVMGILALTLFVAGILILPQFVEHGGLRTTKELYEMYVDAFVVLISVLIGLSVFSMAVGIYLTSKNPKDAYILGAISLIVLRIVLSSLDFFAGETVWLIRSVAHLFDLIIVVFLFLALREA